MKEYELPDKPIVVLDIEDAYSYRDLDLIDQIKFKYDKEAPRCPLSF